MTLIFAQTAWLIPLYPLLAALLSLCWAPGGLARTGPRPCGYLNLLMVAVAFVHSVVAFISLHLASTGPTPPSPYPCISTGSGCRPQACN
jgi:NADH:ubiquinone oxidoreductase subunit 5 (subunit L)/multisubunit Na+/H+ antiporter MnhA subunit